MATTRFPNGLTTTAKNTTLGEFILPDATKSHQYWEDFDYFAATDFTVDSVNSSAALADEDGGVLNIVTGGTDNNHYFLETKSEGFLFPLSAEGWFRARFKVSEVTRVEWVMGFQISASNPLAVSDGIYFVKVDGETAINLITVKNTSTLTSNEILSTYTADTYLDLGFYIDGKGKINVFIDDVFAENFDVDSSFPDDQTLVVSFGVKNGDGNTRTMAVDFIIAAKER
jgi:hypothetical protein